jgi:hypothetical protein
MSNINANAAVRNASPANATPNVAVGMNPPQAMRDIVASEAAAGRGVGEMMIPAGMVKEYTDYIADNIRDASWGVAASPNASLHTLRYSYGTHKGMEAWVADGPPPGEKLKMQVICTPSSHNGDANFETWAKTNTYEFEIRYPDGKRERKSFKVNGQTPEYASASPVIEIDVAKYAGKDIEILGWPSATGVGGYTEARKTTLHL